MKNKLIHNNFNKVAYQYLTNAKIQTSPALEISNLISKYYHGNGLILDLGSGPGTLEHSKKINYPTVAFDLSLQMLKIANGCNKVNGHAGQLPFANNSFPLIISNLMLQWPNDKKEVIAESYRVLKPDGVIILSTLVKPSLHELQEAWSSVDSNPHTLEFLTNSEYLSIFDDSGFYLIDNLSWQTTIYFPSLMDLFRHFKATGTNLTKTSSGLGGKKQLAELEKAYQLLSTENSLPLTYAYLLIAAVKRGN
jgi:malonyl-CoA O-methyltransferase